MKKIIITSIIILCSLPFYAQQFRGDWEGKLKFNGNELLTIFHIQKKGDSLFTTMDSPQQSAFDIPVGKTIIQNDSLFLRAPGSNMEFKAKLVKDDTIQGTFIQNGYKLPLLLIRNKGKTTITLIRPQEPEGPFKYYSEEVNFKNKDENIELAGTLTLPEKSGKFPAVILFSGSGPQNRDEEIFGHKPFLVLSDYLTKKGIAVLRYDDRGTAASTGNFSKANTSNFANDAEAALNYLLARPEIDPDKIGLIGHSDGGVVAPMVASRNENVDFIILLAAPGVPGDQLLIEQNRLISEAMGYTEFQYTPGLKFNQGAFDIIKNSPEEEIKEDLITYFNGNGIVLEDQIRKLLKQLNTPYMRFFIKYNPEKALENTSCPVLAINGSKDLQVAADSNLLAIENSLKKGGNGNYTIKKVEGLNHLFQEAETGLTQEYGKIEQTISPEVLNLIGSWVLKQVN